MPERRRRLHPRNMSGETQVGPSVLLGSVVVMIPQSFLGRSKKQLESGGSHVNKKVELPQVPSKSYWKRRSVYRDEASQSQENVRMKPFFSARRSSHHIALEGVYAYPSHVFACCVPAWRSHQPCQLHLSRTLLRFNMHRISKVDHAPSGLSEQAGKYIGPSSLLGVVSKLFFPSVQLHYYLDLVSKFLSFLHSRGHCPQAFPITIPNTYPRHHEVVCSHFWPRRHHERLTIPSIHCHGLSRSNWTPDWTVPTVVSIWSLSYGSNRSQPSVWRTVSDRPSN